MARSSENRWKVPLADVALTEGDIAAVVDVYRSGWLSLGPQTEAFEDELAAFTGARHAVAVSSGTAALHLMLAGIGLGPGDEVIVPSLTFVATANAVAYTGATPVFADIAGLDAPWLSARAAAALIGERTAAILTMSYGGHPGETAALAGLAADRGIPLLEDAAHGLGGHAGDAALGTLGQAGAYSFFSNKNLAVGEGGALVTDDAALADRARLLRSHGMTSLSWDRHRGHATSYDVIALGFNYRIDEPRAALARRRLAGLGEATARRGDLVARYRDALSGVDGVTAGIGRPGAAGPAHHLFPVVLDEDLERDGFRAALAEAGIQTSVHYPPVHGFSIHAGARRGPLAATEAYAARSVTLPLFAHMSPGRQDLVVEAVARAAAAARTRA